MYGVTGKSSWGFIWGSSPVSAPDLITPLVGAVYIPELSSQQTCQVQYRSSCLTSCTLSQGIFYLTWYSVMCSVKSSDGITPSGIVHTQAVTVSRCVFRSGGFPLAFFIQGLHVITCEMWLKPRGVALMEREAPEHTVSISGLWLRGMYLF